VYIIKDTSIPCIHNLLLYKHPSRSARRYIDDDDDDGGAAGPMAAFMLAA